MRLAYILGPLACISLSLAGADNAPQRVQFRRAVANIEYAALVLKNEPPANLLAAPGDAGQYYFGQLMRRLPGDGPRDAGNYVTFAVEYAGGTPKQAWIDLNLDRSLKGESSSTLYSYPSIRGAKAFLSDFRWRVEAEAGPVPIEWKVRIILEPHLPGEEPVARIQHVYGRVGTIQIEGREHRAFLFDGNGDGLYGREFFDGVFIDLDDNSHFSVDQMSPEFGPFGAPFQMGSHMYQVSDVAADGSWLVLEQQERVASVPTPSIGQMAPDFVHRDVGGSAINLRELRGRPVILHFWASWCPQSEAQAPGLRALYDRFRTAGLRILSVSYDTDRAAMETFRREHLGDWPTSFSGRMLWEDPVGRLYQARWPGAMYLIGPDGRLASVDVDPAKFTTRLEELLRVL